MNFRKESFSKQYFLVLLPVFFLLHGSAENYPMIPFTGCLLLLGKYLLATAVITVLSYLIIRSWRTAAMFAFLIMSFHFFFGPFHDQMKNWFADSFIVKYTFLIPFFFIIFLVIIIFFRKKKPHFRKLSSYLNILFIVLILIDIFQISRKSINYNDGLKTKLEAGLKTCNNCEKPDIFLIVADEYAGKKELQDIFRFDNAAFENELKKRGFHIVDSTMSNYNYTPFSMASMFNMSYLDKLEGRNKSLNDRNLCYRTINNNAVVNFFRNHDYNMVNCSIFQFAGKLPYRSTPYYQTGMDLVTAQTFISRVNRDIRYNLVTRFKIKSETERVLKDELRINEELYRRTMEAAADVSDWPKFVYTHIEMPHYPYYFDRNGKPNPLKDLEDVEQWDQRKYIEYLQYANTKYLELVDHILKNSRKPPVIIFMSDHGFREFKGDTVDHSYHFMNINSILLPGKNYHGFYKGMSNVNQFRVILNTAFSQNLPMLKDSTSFLKE